MISVKIKYGVTNHLYLSLVKVSLVKDSFVKVSNPYITKTLWSRKVLYFIHYFWSGKSECISKLVICTVWQKLVKAEKLYQIHHLFWMLCFSYTYSYKFFYDLFIYTYTYIYTYLYTYMMDIYAYIYQDNSKWQTQKIINLGWTTAQSLSTFSVKHVLRSFFHQIILINV